MWFGTLSLSEELRKSSGVVTNTVKELTEKTEHTSWREYNADMTVTVTVGEAHLLGNPLFLANVKKTEVSSLHGHLNLCN